MKRRKARLPGMDALESGSCINEQVSVFMHSGHNSVLAGAACGGSLPPEAGAGPSTGLLCPPTPVPAEPRVKHCPRGRGYGPS